MKNQPKEIIINLENDTVDLIFFILIFGVVVWLMFPTVSRSMPLPYNCTQHHNNFNACVNAQNAGKGCSWWAECSKCIKDGTNTARVCK